ncbi:MAG TPA: SDR family NAD(P)-dependent oxidoreductase [Paraburkholderia sp.]|jgi:NAD(P)-dependent dehydrogenase (short-subunit alcohol dehydrogenase family)|uniref:SDR family NAD(P)-dependent oxidoreductase n=1 Tax=Paraburkholderia sp. TaxID=1926495 RepID=UPI002B47550B|nr:SDR family NAD(P)-dependent oxidoreductase [Paraburkholderia sp.]HKR46450.1 SDR family NAD(P)-dependent oxidoreductase [Paraburkholderia sp.]
MVVQDKTFFITGGGSGLGAAVGRHLLERGANVVFGDIDVARARDVAALGGERALAVEVDVTLAASVEAAIALATQRFGALHGVVNCAGIAPAQRIVGKEGAHSLDLFAKVVSVNLIGTFNVMRLAAVAMANNTPDAGGERGVIVNTASVAAYDGQIGQSAYAASKGGVVSLTLPAARELARNGIRVVTIAPGIFETPMLLAMPAEVQQALGAGVPFPQRLGQPAEFAALVEHIVGNRYLNGEVIRLDGALRMAPR